MQLVLIVYFVHNVIHYVNTLAFESLLHYIIYSTICTIRSWRGKSLKHSNYDYILNTAGLTDITKTQIVQLVSSPHQNNTKKIKKEGCCVTEYKYTAGHTIGAWWNIMRLVCLHNFIFSPVCYRLCLFVVSEVWSIGGCSAISVIWQILPSSVPEYLTQSFSMLC